MSPFRLESFSLLHEELATNLVATGLAMFVVMLVMFVGLISFSNMVFGSYSSCDQLVTPSKVAFEQNNIRIREDVSDIKRYMFHIKLCFAFLDTILTAHLAIGIPSTFPSDLWLHCPPVWNNLAKWSQCSPPGGGADEIPVYLGEVALSYNLRSVHVPKMQIWSVLLISMLISVLMYRIFELNAKYSIDSASM